MLANPAPLKHFISTHRLVYLCFCACTGVTVGGSLTEVKSFFHHVGTRRHTQVFDLGGNCVCLLSRLTGTQHTPICKDLITIHTIDVLSAL